MARRSISWAALLVALPGLAAAADLPTKKAPVVPPPVFSWTGLYAGTSFGYSFDNVWETGVDGVPAFIGGNPTTSAGLGAYQQKYNPRNVLTDFHLGYLKQYGHLVLGGEFDIGFNPASTTKVVVGNGLNFPATAAGSIGIFPAVAAPGGAAPLETNIQDNWRISWLGKLGYADGKSLYYLLGGLVSGGYTVRHNYWGMPIAYTSFGYSTLIPNNDINDIERFGWTAGGGVEYAFTDKWSANVEYRHTDLGTATVTSTGNSESGLNINGAGGGIFGLTFKERLTEDSVRFGVNYHFGPDFFSHAAPVVAAAEPPKGPKKEEKKAEAPKPEPDPSFIGRLYHAYADEWGIPFPPADPSAPPSRRSYFPPSPEPQAPFPFTEWPMGGANYIGVTTPSSIDSPLMTALAPTPIGKTLNDWHVQIYGWINPGFNISNQHTLPGQITGGNFPAAYAYQPNLLQLDQIVLMFERLPDTVQQDHIDWGFRFSPLFGETYRYTTASGIFSKQLEKWNKFVGYDAPMIYGELYVPGIMEGLLLRLGRYISVPDIEAQLAPNNYMYSHSMTYGYDNYTNQGLIATLQATKNITVQAGIVVGTDSSLWNDRQTQYPALFGGAVYSPLQGIWTTVPAGVFVAGQAAYKGQVDSGIKPSFTGCIRYQTDDAYNAIYSCANGVNTGVYGYNNLQEFTTTLYHKFDENWHISIELWHMHQNTAPNAASPFYGVTPDPFLNQLNVFPVATCVTDLNPTCNSREWAALTYLNWQFSPLDNLSWRAEYFDDITGQRTGFKTSYFNYAMGWQHWFSPTVMIRPEVAFYNSLKTPAFGNGTTSHATIFSADLIWHF